MGIMDNYYEKDNKSQNREYVIILEGMDDIYFISKLINTLNVNSQKIGLVQVGGNQRFKEHLAGFFKTPYFTQGKIRSVAIICDSDDEPTKSIKIIHDALSAANQPTPQSGFHVSNSKGIKIGLFTLPQPGDHGDLEKLCLDTVKDSELAIAAKDYVSKATSIAKQKTTKMLGSIHKREAQVYLGGVPKGLVRGAGRGFYDDYFDIDHTNLNPLKDFLLKTIT